MDPVDVANLGLGYLARGPIASLDDGSKLAAQVKAVFAILRDKVLEDRDWTFAIRRLVIPRAAAAPAFGYPSQYPLPADALRVVEAKEPGGAPGEVDGFMAGLYPSYGAPLEWQKEGRAIVAQTQAAQLQVRAVWREPDSSLWSPSFCTCLSLRLARDLAVPLLENHALMRDLDALYQRELLDAAANDGRQGRTQRVRTSRLARLRRG